MTSRIDTVKDGRGVVTLWIDNAKHKNALNDHLIDALIEGYGALGKDDSVRVIVLRGKGGTFCAGRELDDLLALQKADAKAVHEAYATLRRLNETIYYCPKPTLCAIERYALGLGTALANWSDFAIAEDDSIFGYPEVKIGLPATQTSVSLSRTVLRKAAVDMLLSGRRVAAEEAARLGLITRVVEKGSLEAEVDALTEQLVANSPDAMSQTKRMIWQAEDASYGDALAAAVELISQAVMEPAAREGIAAFLEKRKPNWQVSGGA